MNTIQNLFQQAQLAEAAYADLTTTIGSQSNLLTALNVANKDQYGGSFTLAQATAFVAEWSVVDQYTASGLFGLTDGSGFSATLFKNKSGEYSLSMRGTAGLTDLSADAGDVLADGVALDQIVDMYNYWQSLTHTGAYDAVKLDTNLLMTAELQAKYLLNPVAALIYETTLRADGYIIDNPSHTVRSVLPVSSTELSDARLQNGIGLLPVASAVEVNGHSLGGHLAMAFSRLFPSATIDATAVNGAGFNFGNSNLNNLFTQLHGTPGFDAGKITNVVGSAAMDVVSQDWLFLQQPAGRKEIYTESASLSTVAGHGSSQMTDSLALYNLLATLDPSLNDATTDNLAKLTGFLKAGSNVAANSLEFTLDALRTLLQTDYTLGSANRFALPATVIDDRESLYANLQSLQTYLANSSFNLGTVQAPQYNFTLYTLAEVTGNVGLAETAKTDIATRYALYVGNTFVLDAPGYDLYPTINANGALDLYEPVTHTGNLTDQYFKDRAAFVLAKQKANTDDKQILDIGLYPTNTAWAQQGDEYVLYLDKQGSGLPDYTTAQIYEGQQIDVVTNIKQIQFGSLMNDTLTGGDKGDDLYGMWGNDTLTGGKGNDYLEGGKGLDTYKYATGDGLDTILDTDGNGLLKIDGTTLAGGDQYGDAHVHRDASGHTYTDVGRGLVIDGNIFVQDWKAGNLGINMTGPAAQTNPQTSHTFIGDHPMHTATIVPGSQDAGWRVVGSPYNQQYTTVDNGNGGTTNVLTAYDVDYYLIDPATGNTIEGGGPVRTDTFTDTAANDHILGGGGNDTLNANKGGDDILEGQAGNDYIEAGAGYDVLIGGAGNDILNGGAGDDRLYADTQQDAATAIAQGNAQTGSGSTGDWLNAGTGEDTLVGGNANDLLAGGAGADLLIGGAGDDVIVGDNDTLPSNFPNRTWHPVDYNTSIFLESVRYNTPPAPDTSGNDVIYAGEGNDFAFGDYGNDVILGEKGNDHLFGNSGNDVLLGGDGNDHLYGDSRENYAATPAPGNDYMNQRGQHHISF